MSPLSLDALTVRKRRRAPAYGGGHSIGGAFHAVQRSGAQDCQAAAQLRNCAAAWKAALARDEPQTHVRGAGTRAGGGGRRRAGTAEGEGAGEGVAVQLHRVRPADRQTAAPAAPYRRPLAILRLGWRHTFFRPRGPERVDQLPIGGCREPAGGTFLAVQRVPRRADRRPARHLPGGLAIARRAERTRCAELNSLRLRRRRQGRRGKDEGGASKETPATRSREGALLRNSAYRGLRPRYIRSIRDVGSPRLSGAPLAWRPTPPLRRTHRQLPIFRVVLPTRPTRPPRSLETVDRCRRIAARDRNGVGARRALDGGPGPSRGAPAAAAAELPSPAPHRD
eukprot:364868-Chlamydomonas_euryale.AAC.10